MSGLPPVAVFVTAFPVLSETFVTAEIDALRALGHDVRVESRRAPDRPNDEYTAAFPVACGQDDTRVRKAGALVWLMLRHPVRCALDLRQRRAYADEEPVERLRSLAPVAWRLRRAGVRHVHVHFATGVALDALRLGRILGIPYSLTAHAWDIYKSPRNLPAKLRAAAFVTSGCNYTVDDLRTIAGPQYADRVHRIVMGVDAERFRRTMPIPTRSTVVAVGRLVEKKGFDYLVDAVHQLPHGILDELHVIGDGPLYEDLVTQADAGPAGDRIRFLGALPQSEIRAHLEGASVLVMPCVVASDGDRDSMPVVVKEALAMEVPVIATDEVGLPELVSEGWGRLVAPRSSTELAQALADVLSLDIKSRAEMGARGREHVVVHCSVAEETARLSSLISAAVGD